MNYVLTDKDKQVAKALETLLVDQNITIVSGYGGQIAFRYLGDESNKTVELNIQTRENDDWRNPESVKHLKVDASVEY